MSNAMECTSMEDHGHHLADMGGRNSLTLRLGSQPVKRGKPPNGKHLSEFLIGIPADSGALYGQERMRDPDRGQDGGHLRDPLHRKFIDGLRD